MDQPRLVSFIESGKSVYIEGVDFAYNHHVFPLFSFFGCNFISTGNNSNVQTLTGVEDTWSEGLEFDYQYGSNSDYLVDEISANDGTIFFESQDGIGRGIFNTDFTGYRTIFTATLLGSMIDDDPNTKAVLMEKYLDFLTTPVVSSDDVLSCQFNLSNFPNPFNPTTTIAYELELQDYDFLDLSIYNSKGQKIKTLDISGTVIGAGKMKGSVIWDGKDENSIPVSSGLYFYRLKVDEYVHVNKMILMK